MKALFGFLFTLAVISVHGQIKWNSVEKVYSDLITAIGDGSKIAPPIKSSRTQSKVAYYSPTRQTIFVEEKFLEICATFGPDSLNALTFILGHELAHFYRNHGWVSTSGMGYVDADMQEDWKEMKKDLANHAKDETEADIFSGFYALVAGYNAMPVAENTLKTLYKTYNIPDTVPGYPTLDQRVAIAETAMEKSQDLYTLFNAGLYCVATEKYKVAAQIYTYIFNQDYSGKEILNNLAVAEILQGYQMIGEDPQYYYPIFVSTETALDPNSRGTEGDEHIRKGIFYLQEALKKDPNDFSCYINLASGFTMLDEFVDAEYHLAKAQVLDENNPAISCLQGIIAAKKGDKKMAKKIWKPAKNTSAFVAKNYATIISGETFNGAPETAQESSLSTMMIDEVNLADPRLKSVYDFKVVKLPGLKISYINLDHSTLIEVYGGGGIDYRFQNFKSSDFETVDFGWNAILKSPTSIISGSSGYNVLKIENTQEKAPAYVKYVWY